MRNLANPVARPGHRRARALRPVFVVACLPLLLHCGGDNGTGGIVEQTPPPVFTASGTASAPDLITLAYGGTEPGSLIQVDVKLGGPHAASDIFAFAFDLVLSNPSLVRGVTAEPGDALTGDQLAPQAALMGDRVVVGVSKAGGAGNGIAASGATVVKLVFKMDPTNPGTTALTFDQANSHVESPNVCSKKPDKLCDANTPCGESEGTCQVQQIGITFDPESAKIEQPK